jgi:subtilase family serine protease
MTSARRGAVLALAACTLVGAAGAASAARPSSTGLVRLTGNVLPSLAALASSPAPLSQLLTVGVALEHPHAAQEEALASALTTPGSPSYGKFLTLEQVVSRFGVPRSRTDHVVATLRKAGLQVAAPDAMGDYVSATGTVAQVQKAFQVKQAMFSLKDGTRFLANLTGPVVAAVDHVTTVVGLNTLQHFTRPAGHTRTAQDVCLTGLCIGDTTPQDLWSIYQQPAGRTGQGVSMAIIGEGDPKNLQGWLAKHEATYHLPKTKLTVRCVQGNCGTDTSGDVEWQIDTQASAAMAPGNAGETLYFAKSLQDSDLNNSFIAWAHDPKGPKLASASLGECESSPLNGLFTGPLKGLSTGPLGVLVVGNGEQAAIEPVLRSAVLMGKTLFASTGDTGSSCPLVALPGIGAGNGLLNQGLPEQNYPAVSRYAVAVGGTVLYGTDNGTGAGATYKPGKPAGRTLEYAWTFGGGGPSLWLPAPPWQTTVPGINTPCLTSLGSKCRAVPDVSAVSGDVLANGFSVVGAGGFTSGGGTSLSSPLWMGMWARVQGAAGRNLGFAAPWLYRAASTPAGYSASFTDVTLGTNGLHLAGKGYDYTTGLGTPRVAGLIKTLLHHS